MRVFARVRPGVLLVLGACTVAHARPAPRPVKRVALSPWQQAIDSREAFKASGEKTRADYTRVMDEFRAVYHHSPRDVHAAEAVDAVAALLAEQGRTFHDAKSLRAAIGQYEFLRQQYPGSTLRTQALLAEGNIAADDLHEAGLAREKYQALLKEAPRSPAAGEARGQLAALDRGAEEVEATHRKGAMEESHPRKAEPAAEGLALTDENARRVEREAAVPEQAHVSEAKHGAPQPVADSLYRPAQPVAEAVSRSARPLALVTAIRHWSTPTYTRVAIDLGDEVTFQAARVPHPDRLYFDLHGARLGAELVGKSFNVTDNGFLTRIRAAQDGDVTRVVLDVNDVTEYSAFLLPNPYRLIIDIHGKKREPAAPQPLTSPQPLTAQQPIAEHAPPEQVQAEPLAEVPVAPAAVRQASVAATRSGLPPMAPTDGGDAVRAAAVPSEHSVTLPSARRAAPHPVAVSSLTPAPRTGVVTRPTPTRPVPNAVAVKVPDTETEVAAVSTAPGRVEATSLPTSKPVVSVTRPRTGSSAAVPARAADKTADGETSLIRALGLKVGRIVIDAGHGGHDSGTLGVDGIEEKDVVLDVALRLGKLLHERLGAEIIYTRSDDTFIPLETRTAIANKAQADLFLSIHANSSQDPTARGVETYYLNFTSDPTALDVAARENAVSGSSVHQLSDLVKKITLKDKIAESREFATDVESSLYAGLERGNAGLKNRGVKKAPFVVLIGANMPSILAEISFVTNPRDASQLRQPEYRERVAESLFNGVARYEAGLAGARPVPSIRAAAQ